MDITDIWKIARRLARGVVRRRKLLAVASGIVALGVLIPAAYHFSKEPPRFRTLAVILLEARPDRVPVFQEFSPFRPLAVQLAILRSRSLAESVVETLPKTSLQDLIDNPYHVDYESVLRNTYRRYMGQEPQVDSPQRRALRELQQARVTFDVRGEGLVTIAAEASRPQVSIDIVNAYIEALMARTRSFNIDDSRVTREFLEQQLADVKKSLGSAEQGLRSFVNAHGGVKIPERNQTTVTQLSQAETALGEIGASRKMLEARIAALRQKAETQKKEAAAAPPAPAPPRGPSPALQRLRTQLAQLETALLDLRIRFTDEHPRVRLVKDRIAELQAQLGDAIRESGPVVPSASLVPPAERINFAEQLVAMEASYHAVAAQEEALRKQADSLRQSLEALSSSEQEYSRLAREADSSRNLHALLADKLTAARIREQGEMKVVKVIDPPSHPMPTMSQRRLKIMALALMLAGVMGVGVPAAAEWLHRKVETEDDVDLATGLPVLAALPRLRSNQPLFTGSYSETAWRPSEEMIFTEALRTLRVTLQLAMKTDQIRTVLVASPWAHEGKSTLVLNLGLAFSEVGTRVVVADSDLQRPVLHRGLKVKNNGGLVKVLHEEQPLDDALTKVGANMWLIPRGESVYPETRGMLATSRLRAFVDELATRAELVICDSSPVLMIHDNLFLASAVDAVILVAKAGTTACRDLARAKALLEGAGARVLGVVINEMPVSALRGHYRRYYHSYVKKGSR